MRRYFIEIPEPKAKRLDRAIVYIGYQDGFSGFTRVQEIELKGGEKELIFDAEPGYVLASETNDCDANIIVVIVEFSKRGSTRKERFVVEPALIKRT